MITLLALAVAIGAFGVLSMLCGADTRDGRDWHDGARLIPPRREPDRPPVDTGPAPASERGEGPARKSAPSLSEKPALR